MSEVTGNESQGQEQSQNQGQSRDDAGRFSSNNEAQQQQAFLDALNAKFGDLESKISEKDQTLNKLKEAFAPEKKKDDSKWIDAHLKTLLEARQRGQEMPITEDLVVQMQRQMDTIQKLEQELKQAKGQVDRFSNPATWQDNQVYSEMDNTLSSTIERIYGKPSPEIHRTVSGVIADRLKQVRAEAPDVWEQIRNSKEAQRKIVHKAVSEIVPPQAMNMMRQAHEDAQPITQQDFEQAWREASQIEDPKLRSKAKEAIRIKLYEHTNPMRMRRK